MNAPKISDSLTTTSCEILPMTPHSEVAPDPQKIDHFFGESVERQKNNKTMNTTKMNKQIKTKKTITCSTCGKTGHNKNNEKFHPDYKFTGVSVPTPVKLGGREYTHEEREKIEDGKLQPLCFGCNIKTNTHRQQFIDELWSGGFYTFCCDNTVCIELQWNSVVDDGDNNYYRVKDKAELRHCYKCGVRGGRYSFEGGEELYEVDDEWYCGECKDTLPTDEEKYEEGEKEFIDACLNDDFDTMKSLFEQKKNKSFNPDDQDLIIIKGGAPEPIPIVKIQPCVEQTPIEKPIVKDSNYDAVIAEINAGVCSLDNAIRINKHILFVKAYSVNPNTQFKSFDLRCVERFGSCPHNNVWDGGKKNTYTVGNIFGETKVEITKDGEIIYDRTYFKGKDKQKYFATRWGWRPESSSWQNCFLDSTHRWNKSGVEILGMKGTHLTKDGKYKYEGVSIAQLKDACKNNGVKGTSGKDKHELVKLLMKI